MEGAEQTCGDDKHSCVIEAKIKVAAKKGSIVEITKAGCDAMPLGDKTKIFVVPEELHELADTPGVQLPYYCKEDNCNVQAKIEAEITEKEKLEAMVKDNKDNKASHSGEGSENADEGTHKGGAAQTTVAVATIAFSMVMARLAL